MVILPLKLIKCNLKGLPNKFSSNNHLPVFKKSKVNLLNFYLAAKVVGSQIK